LRESVLDSYHQERHPVAEGLIRGTNFAYTGILHPSQLKQHAARLFGPFLIGNAAAQGFMRSTLEELKIFYPDSPLNLDLGGARGPKPGERVLDATVVRASDGATTSLHELTRGPLWTLLLFSGVERPATEHNWATVVQQVATRYAERILVYTVLAGAAAPSNQAACPVLLDALQLAHERYGVAGPVFYLLRPDTYVAARGRLSEAEKLAGYLEKVFA
jgi:3-(3-hydroxy-phenyl)propionate hydroxylase